MSDENQRAKREPDDTAVTAGASDGVSLNDDRQRTHRRSGKVERPSALASRMAEAVVRIAAAQARKHAGATERLDDGRSSDAVAGAPGETERCDERSPTILGAALRPSPREALALLLAHGIVTADCAARLARTIEARNGVLLRRADGLRHRTAPSEPPTSSAPRA